MPVSPTNRASAASTINAGIGTLAQNYETFLHLLTTQLKNQDPLSPLDTNEFTSQLTQMTGVQQQLLTNQLLTQLIGQNQATIGGSAVNLLGKEVTAETDQAKLAEGKAAWTYSLPAAAAEMKFEVLNSNGSVIWTGSTPGESAGAHTFNWNGTDLSGRQVPDGGTYSLRITAVDGGGRTLNPTLSVKGVASGLQTVGGQTMITVGGVPVPLTAITSISAPPPA